MITQKLISSGAITPDDRPWIQHLTDTVGFKTVCGLPRRTHVSLYGTGLSTDLKPELYAECGVCFQGR